MAVRRTVAGWMFALATLAAAPGCGDSPTGSSALVDDGLRLSVTSATLKPGESLRVEAAAAAVVTWASSDPAVVAVSPEGVLAARKAGAAEVTARSNGKRGKVKVEVTSPPPTPTDPAPAPTDPAPAPTDPAPTPTQPAGGSTLLYAHDFNDGTIGTFGQWGGYTPQPVSVVADPTGSGRGSVARIVYERDPASGGSPDVNAGLYAKVNPAGGHAGGVGFGERIYLAGDFYLPRYQSTAPAQGQYDLRKLFYIKFGDPNSRSGHIVVNAYGRADKSGLDLGLASGLYGSSQYLQDYGLGSIGFDRWHKLEVEIVANHKGASDGIVRMWLNGQLVRERTGVLLFSASPSEATDFIYEYGIGNQEQWQASDVMKNYRLWDNIEFRTARP